MHTCALPVHPFRSQINHALIYRNAHVRVLPFYSQQIQIKRIDSVNTCFVLCTSL